jgi:hypothetical protein
MLNEGLVKGALGKPGAHIQIEKSIIGPAHHHGETSF